MSTKQFLATITKEAGRLIEFVGSHQLVDRDGEVILISGIDTTDFLKNPTLLEQHASREAAVGEVRSLSKTMLLGTPAMVGKAYLPDRPRSNEVLADVRAGLLNGVSIGFLSLETGPPILPGQTGVTHTKTKLLEISLVTLPACPTCLVTSKSAKSSCSCGNGNVLEIRDDSLALEIIEPPTHLDLENFIDMDDTRQLNQAIGRVVQRELANVITEQIGTSLRDAIDYARGRVR